MHVFWLCEAGDALLTDPSNLSMSHFVTGSLFELLLCRNMTSSVYCGNLLNLGPVLVLWCFSY